jgi:hypothetical protein
LKPAHPLACALGELVAPRRGAWIETLEEAKKEAREAGSHPAGVRGLKHQTGLRKTRGKGSHPAGVRGLKPYGKEAQFIIGYVAPRRGAWIETSE